MSQRALREFGQNFLVNSATAEKIVRLSKPTPNDNYLEIGPGMGALTFPLSRICANLLCIEIDSFLSEQLRQKLLAQKLANVTVQNVDFMKFSLSSVNFNPYKIIGALPYNMAKRIISKCLAESQNRPLSLTFVVQKEVADEYTAEPPSATFLSNFARVYSTCNQLYTIKKEQFSPRPKVDGAVLHFELKPYQKKMDPLAQFIKALFSSPRKTIKNNLLSSFDLDSINTSIDLTARPATLTFEQIEKIYDDTH